jgi:hypothetical protein
MFILCFHRYYRLLSVTSPFAMERHMLRKIVLPALPALMLLFSGNSCAEVLPPIQKVFNNWQITCNNLNDCDVRNVDENMSITLKRQAGPQGKVSLEIIAPDSDKVSSLWFDQQEFPLQDSRWHSTIDEGDADLTTDQLSLVQSFIAAAKSAQMLFTSADSQDGSSMTGLSTALMMMDERQGRVNNQTALISIGDLPASRVPAAYPPPVIHPALLHVLPLKDAPALINAVYKESTPLLNKEECDVGDEAREHSEAQPLTNDLALVMLNCVTGAYQSSSILFVTPRNNPQAAQQLKLPLPLPGEDGKPQIVSWFTDPSYSSQDGILSHSARGRGISDCGESAQWVYDGKEFQLTSFNSQPACSGGEPGDWPSIWATTSN